MKVLVIGGNGFLGRKLLECLGGMEVEVYSAVRRFSEIPVENCRYILVDEIISLQIQDLPKFDVIINVAMKRSSRVLHISDEILSHLNFSIPLEIIRRTSSESTLVINTSTYIQNFGGVKGKTVETYGASKQLLTEALEVDALKGLYQATDLYLFTLYGPSDRTTHLIPLIFKALKNKTSLPLTEGLQLMNLLYLDDAANSIIAAMANYQPGYSPYYLWEQKYLTVQDLVLTMEEIVGDTLEAQWGSLGYSGHEMFEPWPIPFPQFPGLSATTTLVDGLMKSMC
jgi:nucleoside-diphosphate-sugar epimerase